MVISVLNMSYGGRDGSAKGLDPVLASLCNFVVRKGLASSVSAERVRYAFFSPVVEFSSLTLVFFELAIY